MSHTVRNNYGQCWHCNSIKVFKLIEPIDNSQHLSNSPVLICSNCGFIYKKPLIDNDEFNNKLKKSYYSSFDEESLLARSRARALVDESRAVDYLRYIEQFISLKDVKKALDIGGAEGFFSNTLQKYNNQIKVYCLEPDIQAIKVGKNLYPNVNFIQSRLENLDEFDISDFDLVTYWGGLYRTVNPRKALKSLHTKTSENATLVFSLPFKLDDPRNQAEEEYESIYDILGNASISLLDDAFMKSFVGEHFNVISYESRQNFPFLKKIPFLVATKQKSTNYPSEILINESKFNKTLAFLKKYAYKLSKKRLINLKESLNIENIAIWGDTQEANILSSICTDVGINVKYFITKNGLAKNVSIKNSKLLSEVYRDKVDALFIADIENQVDIYDQLCNRIHLNRLLPIIKGFDSVNNKRITCTIFDEEILGQAFSFSDN